MSSQLLRVFRDLKRFRVKVGDASTSSRDSALRSCFRSNNSQFLEIGDSVATVTAQLFSIISTVKLQPKFLRGDIPASIIAGYGSERQASLVSQCVRISQALGFKSSAVQRASIVALAECGQVDEAYQKLETLSTSQKSPFLYNSMLYAYLSSKSCPPEQILSLLGDMEKSAVIPNLFTAQHVVRLATLSAHPDLIFRAESLLHSFPSDSRSVVSYTSLMISLCRSLPAQVSTLFDRMISCGIRPDKVTVMALLRAATLTKDVVLGERAWSIAQQLGEQNNAQLLNMMVYLYGKCGNVAKSEEMFERIPKHQRDVYSYTSFLAALSSSPQSATRAESVFDSMLASAITATDVTVLTLLRAAAVGRNLNLGMRAWKLATELGVYRKLMFMTAAVDMFGKCEDVQNAVSVFGSIPEAQRDLIAYSAVILAHSFSEDTAAAVRGYFEQMRAANIVPDQVTVLTLLRAAAVSKDQDLGTQAWEVAGEIGAQESLLVITAAIDMFGKCGSVTMAAKLFETIPKDQRDVVAYNSVILAHSCSNETGGVRALFDEMVEANMQPDAVTVVALLSAAAASGNISLGTFAVNLAQQIECTQEEYVISAVIDMYGCCRRTDEALAFFERLAVPFASSYTALISAVAARGYGSQALKYFEEGCSKFGVSEPLAIVCLQTLSHSYMVKEAVAVFHALPSTISSLDRVIASMIDVYARVGQLDDAMLLLQKMKTPTLPALLCILSGCRLRKNLDIGQDIFERIKAIDSRNSSAFVLMSNLLTAVGKLDEAQALQAQMVKLKMKKVPGISTVVVGDAVTNFYTHHQHHVRISEIKALMKSFDDQLLQDGYIPDESCVSDPHCDTREKRRRSLCEHSERYALTYSVLVLPPNADIDIVQNLRVCGDCHEIAKRLSRLLRRRIFLRDSARYHTFENGACDCRDQW